MLSSDDTIKSNLIANEELHSPAYAATHSESLQSVVESRRKDHDRLESGNRSRCCCCPVFLDLIHESLRSRWLAALSLLILLTFIILPSFSSDASQGDAFSCLATRVIDQPMCTTVMESNQTYVVLTQMNDWGADSYEIFLSLIFSSPCLFLGNSLYHSVLWLVPGLSLTLYAYFMKMSPSVGYCGLNTLKYRDPANDVQYYEHPRCVDINGYVYQPNLSNNFTYACGAVALDVCETNNKGFSHYSDFIMNVLLYLFVTLQILFCIKLLFEWILAQTGRCGQSDNTLVHSDGNGPSSSSTFRVKWGTFMGKVQAFKNNVSQRMFPVTLTTTTPTTATITSEPTRSLFSSSSSSSTSDATLLAELSSVFRFPLRLWIATALGFIVIGVIGLSCILLFNDAVDSLVQTNSDNGWFDVSTFNQWMRELKAIFFLSAGCSLIFALLAGWFAQRDFKRDCLQDQIIRTKLLSMSNLQVTTSLRSLSPGVAMTSTSISTPSTRLTLQSTNTKSGSFGSMEVDERKHEPVSTSPDDIIPTPMSLTFTDPLVLSQSAQVVSGFVGSYVASVLLATLIIFIILMIVFLCIIWDPIRSMILDQYSRILTIILTKLVHMLQSWLVLRYVIGPGPQIKHPRIFAFFDLLSTFMGAITGPLAAISRLVLSFGSALVQMFRIDRSIVLPPFQSMDPLFSLYQALIRTQEHRYEALNQRTTPN